MRRLLTLAFAISTCLSVQALSIESPTEVSKALALAADLGPNARTNYSTSDSNEFVLGVVLTEESGKLLVLQRQSTGGYRLVAASSAFESSFGPRYYIEIVQSSGERRFAIQVNSHSACGIQVEIYRLANTNGIWRVTGYDKSEPDSATCDVNLRSREYSANLLTHKVSVVEYRNGKVVKRKSRITKSAAPELKAFSFSMFQDEP